MTDAIDPRKIFYVALDTDNGLSSAYPAGIEGSGTFLSEKTATDYATENVEEHGGEFVIVRCVPVRRIHRPPMPSVTIEEIEDPTGQRRRRKPDAPAKAKEGKGAETAGNDGKGADHQLPPQDEFKIPGFLRRDGHSPESVTEAEAG